MSQPRPAPPRMPGGELTLEPPPEPERMVPAGLLQRLLPLVMLLGSVGLHRGARRRQPHVVAVRRHVRDLHHRHAAHRRTAAAGAAGRPASTRTVATTCATCPCSAGGYGASPPSSAPRSSGCTRIRPPGRRCSAAGRLWERKPADPGLRPACASAAVPSGSPRGWSPRRPGRSTASSRSPRSRCAGSCSAHAVVPDLPVALSLRASGTVWLEPAGPAPAWTACARWPAPSSPSTRSGTSPPTPCSPWWRRPRSRHEWEWVKWLPHAAHPRRQDAGGPLRMITADADDVRRWWLAELAGRARRSGHRRAAPAGRGRRALPRGPGRGRASPGVTVLRVGAPPGPAACTVGGAAAGRAGAAAARQRRRAAAP